MGKVNMLRSARVTFSNGKVITTDLSSKLKDSDIEDYYSIGKAFNIGQGEDDLIVSVVKLEILK